MKILSTTVDYRINSTNIYAESSFEEYLSYAKDIIENNDLQRRRVRSSKTVYSLLKDDLLKGCIMPPLVLAIQSNDSSLDDLVNNSAELYDYIINHKNDVVILDGLQRTYTLLDAQKEVKTGLTSLVSEETFNKYQLRLEVYVNINRFGVLYRMLTLNTGQTPMSLRHQLEMLYRDMLNTRIDGVTLVSDLDGKANPENREFVFKHAIEGFNSYISRSEQPIDRQELLENINIMEHMANENMKSDLFKVFVDVYLKFFNCLASLAGAISVDDEMCKEFGITGSPFGKSVYSVFSTSQAMTGFGSAIGIMKDKGLISDLNSITSLFVDIEEGSDNHEWLLRLLSYLDVIRNKSKKIGNSQRAYFHYFFRELFTKDSDSYACLLTAVETGYKKYDYLV